MIKVAVFGIVASLIAMKIKTIRPVDRSRDRSDLKHSSGNVWTKTNGGNTKPCLR